MSIPCKLERSILSYDEHEIILRSHHPEIYDAALDAVSYTHLTLPTTERV